MKIEIPNEALDEFLVQSLKDGLDGVRYNRRSVQHPEDIANHAQLEGAFVTLLEYYMCHTDFIEFIKEEYRGSNADS
jgi:hypothetical protein